MNQDNGGIHANGQPKHRGSSALPLSPSLASSGSPSPLSAPSRSVGRDESSAPPSPLSASSPPLSLPLSRRPRPSFGPNVLSSSCPPHTTFAAVEDAADSWQKRSGDHMLRERAGEALTQKRSLISSGKTRTRSQDQFSDEFEAEGKAKGGRARGASFTDPQSLRGERGMSSDDSIEATPVTPRSSEGTVPALLRHEEVYMEGWLTKITTEQRRWFVLTADTFAYYKDEHTTGVEARTRVPREDLRKVSRSVVGGVENARRAQNALLRMVKTPRTRKKGFSNPSSPHSGDAFGSSSPASPSRNTKSQQSPTTGSEKNLTSFAPTFYILTACAQERAYALAAEDCVEAAVWMLALSGLAHSNLSAPDTLMDELERRELLRYVHFEGYKGGILKTSREEEWHYWAKGVIKSDRGVDPPISYSWDGESFSPILKGGDAHDFGRGKWNGVWIDWYPSGSSTPILKYQWHPIAREYRTERESENWKWTRHFLASTSGQGEWIMEGEIPEIVVMMLQLLVYARDQPLVPASPGRCEEDIIKSRMADFAGSENTNHEIVRLMHLKHLSEHRKRGSCQTEESDGEATSL